MDAFLVYFRGDPVRTFELGEAPVTVGGAGCDVALSGCDLPRCALVVQREDDGTIVTVDPRSSRRRVVRPGELVHAGDDLAIARVEHDEPRPEALRTERISTATSEQPAAYVVIGRGSDARRTAIAKRALTIGSDPRCDVAILDRAVSALHCRLEPWPDGLVLRDLASRNGTFVDGVRTLVARVGPGARLRIGRTDLAIVASARKEEAPPAASIVARSAAMQDVLASVDRFARLPYTTLITGESGTGKEALARALHDRGPRHARAFVAINAGGLPRDLIESELFGHERGAFTGALGVRRGVFEQADGGTLFLDEIGELPLPLQARLLRVLETGDVRRVGAEQSIRVDARVVGATHRDLHAMVEAGTFRQDLFYRLGQLFVHVPPLRERPDDVRALAEHFLALTCRTVGPRELTESAFDVLETHAWPGNARELRNVVQAAAASAVGAIDAHDVDAALRLICGPRRSGVAEPGLLARAALARHNGNVTAAARALGIPRTTLRDRVREPR